ncbi:hypothetical protein PENSTE_c023G09629 [Penicillium steckii]|uniref:Uncharacterized protein n=1 Tax=Penicillium steckii TaxID=303698 RepID=A0A1V6SSG1_9EURO|nr:hypothetical protein PENSTE_c023G09629 [Penicillium steckii]
MKMNLSLLALAAIVSPVFSAAAGQGAGSNSGNVLARDSQACYDRAPYGCSEKGWCWQKCANGGEWCWLAHDGGNGDWKSCSSETECSPDNIGDSACAQGGCDACGCSC